MTDLFSQMTEFPLNVGRGSTMASVVSARRDRQGQKNRSHLVSKLDAPSLPVSTPLARVSGVIGGHLL